MKDHQQVSATSNIDVDDEQLLLYVGGEGGTGKSQIIKAITCSLQIMGRFQELALLAPTGAAADNIDGSTIHSALGMKVEGLYQRVNKEMTKVTKQIQALQNI